jgi:hypothetical protein
VTARDWREMMPDDDPFPEAPWPEPPSGRPAEADLAAIAARYTPVDWPAAFTGQPEDTDWLWGEFLERGTLNALFARPSTGKSLLALEIAVDVVRCGQTVVYLDEENRVIDLVDRLQAFGCHPGELERLRLYSFAYLPPLDDVRGGLHLRALVEAHDAALVVIDTATRMVTGHENDSDTFLALYRCALAPLKARGVTVLRLDHPGKDESRGQRGSSAKDGDVDTAWHMRTAAEGREYRLERTKSRSGHGPAAWTLRRRYEPLRHEWAPTGERSAAEAARMAEILSALDREGLPPEAGRDRVRTVLKQAGIKASTDLVRAAIRARQPVRGQRADSGSSDHLSAVPTPWGGQPDRHQSPDTGPTGRIAAVERGRADDT